LGNLDSGLQVQGKNSSVKMGFWRGAARTSRLLNVRNEVIGEKMGVTQTIVGRLENDLFS
jgi:hypothetical protein